MEQKLRDQQLTNTYLEEEIDEQIDQTETLTKDVDFMKKEILQSSSRQQKYLEELIYLYKNKDT